MNMVFFFLFLKKVSIFPIVIITKEQTVCSHTLATPYKTSNHAGAGHEIPKRAHNLSQPKKGRSQQNPSLCHARKPPGQDHPKEEKENNVKGLHQCRIEIFKVPCRSRVQTSQQSLQKKCCNLYPSSHKSTLLAFLALNLCFQGEIKRVLTCNFEELTIGMYCQITYILRCFLYETIKAARLMFIMRP